MPFLFSDTMDPFYEFIPIMCIKSWANVYAFLCPFDFYIEALCLEDSMLVWMGIFTILGDYFRFDINEFISNVNQSTPNVKMCAIYWKSVM